MTDDKLMREEFEKWYGFEVCEDMDIQTDVAWRNWQVAWNAAIRACAAECARIALSVWDNGEEGAHGGEQANRTAKAIRERFGVE